MAFKILAIECLERLILAMLTRRSNRLSYVDLILTIDCSYSKDYKQPNCSAYNTKFKMVSKNYGHREARTFDLSNVSSKL